MISLLQKTALVTLLLQRDGESTLRNAIQFNSIQFNSIQSREVEEEAEEEEEKIM